MIIRILLERVSSIKYLSVHITEGLTWKMPQSIKEIQGLMEGPC